MAVSRPRTVVLCFDGLSFDYLDAFDLPNFSSLRSRGIEAPLESTFPPWTGSAWPSMYTGMDPSNHGVFDFFSFRQRYPDESELVTRNDVKAPAIWNYLSTLGLPTIVLNMPVTYPVEPIEGVLLPGYLAPETADGYPAGIRQELDAELGTYRIYSRAELGQLDDYSVADYVELIDLRRRAARHLLKTKDWRLAIIQVQKTDAVFHKFNDTAAFERVYRAADDLLGTIVDTVGSDTNTVVCSDHGIGPTTGYRIYLNQILQRAGYVESTDSRTAVPRLKTEKERLTDDARGTDSPRGDRQMAPRAVSVARSGLERVGITMDDLSTVAHRLGVLQILTHHFSERIRATLERGIDWRASRAYCRSGNELGVRINLVGREPDGTVPEAEYETVRDELIDLLSKLETPDGAPAFEFVKRSEEVYRGPYRDDACDILFLPRGINHTIATNLMGVEFVSIDNHDHKSAGTFIGAGPRFDAAAELERLSLTDVAPIAMALLGCPVPDGMTGSVPDGLLTVPATIGAYEDVPFGSGVDEDGIDDEVENRLEDLGYLG